LFNVIFERFCVKPWLAGFSLGKGFFRILIVDFKIWKLIWISIISLAWAQGLAASAGMQRSISAGQQIFSTPTVLACGGGGSDSERRPKRPGHQQKTTTSVPTAPAEVKP
jgi:hypothetical protein